MLKTAKKEFTFMLEKSICRPSNSPWESLLHMVKKFLDSVFRDFPYWFVYIDDILIASRNLEEHIIHLKEMFRRLQKNGLVLKISKCSFAKSEVDFLGHHVSASDIRPTTERIQAILDFNRQNTIKQLRRSLGMRNFYRRLSPKCNKTSNKIKGFSSCNQEKQK
ncbi:hypothetical protein TNCV_3094961 [Trichonephila clavipes]|nr:hypothetical protein TNCV_3094961 [Trichonephila clavipes]